jgi:hypothetical protein
MPRVLKIVSYDLTLEIDARALSSAELADLQAGREISIGGVDFSLDQAD